MARPYKWTVEQLRELIEAYFEKTEKNEYSVTGLALDLDASRQTLDRYQKRKAFKKMITMAKLKVENSYE